MLSGNMFGQDSVQTCEDILLEDGRIIQNQTSSRFSQDEIIELEYLKVKKAYTQKKREEYSQYGYFYQQKKVNYYYLFENDIISSFSKEENEKVVMATHMILLSGSACIFFLMMLLLTLKKKSIFEKFNDNFYVNNIIAGFFLPFVMLSMDQRFPKMSFIIKMSLSLFAVYALVVFIAILIGYLQKKEEISILMSLLFVSGILSLPVIGCSIIALFLKDQSGVVYQIPIFSSFILFVSAFIINYYVCKKPKSKLKIIHSRKSLKV